MGVLRTAMETILTLRATDPKPERAIDHHLPETITRRLAHLLLLPRFDVVRPYNLRQVRPLGLGLVAGGQPTLGYSTLEHFLGDMEALGVAVPLGDALAHCYLEVWPIPAEGAFFYCDNRRKVRYSGYPTAAGKISATDRFLGGTTQLFIHDAAGHGLHMHSGPADDRLTRTLHPFVRRFVALVGQEHMRGIVADQEMRSVALFLALEAEKLGFVTISRTPTPEQEADFEIEGLFVPYLRDPQTGDLTHWVAHAHIVLQDRKRGLAFPAEVALVVDVRAGLPGRLIPVVHNLRQADLPVEMPHRVYVGHWQGQERVFRDMRAGQNIDAHYGQKKRAVSNRRQEREQEALGQEQRRLEKQVATAQGKVQMYAEKVVTLEQEVQQKQADTKAARTTLQEASREAASARQRERLLVRAERLAGQSQIQQMRLQERRRRSMVQQQVWQQTLAKRQKRLAEVTDALAQATARPFYDFDLEKDDLMTYLRMAGENAHRFVQERYFAGTWLEKADEATMVRVIYNQPGWVRREGQDLHVLLQGYRDPDVQLAVVHACQRVNQAQIKLVSGQRLRMAVAVKVLDC